MKTLVIILDGAPEPDGSAYQKAKTPALDALAGKGMCGLWPGPQAPEGYNIKSLSELGMLGIFGYRPSESPGRGFMEALALGIETKPEAVYIRANFATVDNSLKIVDRRAGRDDSLLNEIACSLTKEIEGISCSLVNGKGHRGVLVLEGPGLSSKVSDVDVGGEKPAEVKALEPEGELTARVLNKYLEWSHRIMEEHEANKKRKVPANYLLIRSPGMEKPVEGFSQRYGIEAHAAGNDTIFNGISAYLGMGVVSTGDEKEIEENLEEKLEKALEQLEGKDMVFLHIKGTDNLSHDKDLEGKARFLEEVDSKVFANIPQGIAVAVISDHATSSVTGEHSFGEIPFLVYNGKDSNNLEEFNEYSCRNGFTENEPMKRILSLTRN